MGPTPARTTTLKWRGSVTSRLCTSGAQVVTCAGSVKKDHTRSRGASMSSLPSKRIFGATSLRHAVVFEDLLHLPWCDRNVDVPDAQMCKGVDNRVGDRRRRADGR